MAQTKVQRATGVEGLGGLDKLRFAQLNIANTAAETTITVTPADVGMTGFVMWASVGQVTGGVGIIPTYTGNLATSLALTFAAGAEVDMFFLGV